MVHYTSMYSHPLWKAKRKEVLQRDSKKCQQCGATKNLQVHHKKYTRRIWEAPLEDLITLCDSCHKKASHQVAAKPVSIQLFPWSSYKGYTEIKFYLIHVTTKSVLIEGAEGKLYWLPLFTFKDCPESLWIAQLNTASVYKDWVERSKFKNALEEETV